MAVLTTPRFDLTRWTSDEDPWSREQIDANFASLEASAVHSAQGVDANRPAAGIQRRLYLATDTERVYLDDGDEWHELPTLASPHTWTGDNDFTGGLKISGETVATAAALTAHIDDTTGAHAASAISFAPAGDVAATDVQAAIAELAGEKATVVALNDHLTDTTDAHDASAISYAPTGSIAATDVQTAVAEVATEAAAALTAHIDDTTDAHDASAISYAGSTDLIATTVEAALDELDTEKLAKAGGTATGLITFGAGAGLADGQDLTVGTGTGSKIGQTTSKIGFFGATPTARPGTYNLTGSVDRTLGAYASDPESTPYTGSPADAASTAKLADLNALRTAYENLRVYVEDLAGIVIGTATDLKTLGLVG